MKTISSTKKVLAYMLSLLMIIGVIAFNYDSTEVKAAKKTSGKLNSISVSNLPAKTLTLKKGKSKVLKVKVKTSGKKVSKAYTFKSSKPEVIKVTKKGKNVKLTAKKTGKAKITIKSKANSQKKVTINVTVGTPVSKVTLNKKSKTIDKGKTFTLKASVLPKKASNKTVAWESSNTKVATVSSKGVVKGISAGTAKITAYAADGSGKKSTCTITVTDITDVKSAEILKSSYIKVTLTKPQQLSSSNFTIKTKSYDNGNYNKVCKIDSITTSDKINYYINLESGSGISENKLVQINITGLSGFKGTKTLEVRYEQAKIARSSDTILTAWYNNEVTNEISLEGYGYSKIVSTSGLPTGIKAKLSDSGYDIEFYGKPTVTGKFDSVITTEDELGNTSKYNITYLIGSDDTIAASTRDVKGLVGTWGFALQDKIYVSGGSRQYEYEIVGENYGLSIYDEYIEGTITSAGSYNVTVKVTDKYNSNISTTTNVKIEVKNALTIKGVTRDANGNAVPFVKVSFENTDITDPYYSYDYTYSDENGEYSIDVTSGTYDILVNTNQTTKHLYNVNINSSKSGLDLSLPVYKVIISSNNSDVTPDDFSSWYSTDGQYYGEGNVLYLKAGSYNLTCTGDINSFGNIFKANVNVTVTNSSVAVTANVTCSSNVQGNIEEEKPISTSISTSYKYYLFTPKETGTYEFYSSEFHDAIGALYDTDGTLLITNDDYDDMDFYFTYECEAGTTYYFAVKDYSYDYTCGTINVRLLDD